nr:MAG TPA: adenine specific DNA methyltransferase [Caudoviricetes sp.]
MLVSLFWRERGGKLANLWRVFPFSLCYDGSVKISESRVLAGPAEGFSFAQKRGGVDLIDYKSPAEPRGTTGDGVPVFCAYDEIVALGDIRPNPGNPNDHNKKQIRLLGDIIQATGWRAPITVSKRSGLITKGHGRRMAAAAMGWKTAPVEYQDYASEEEEHADLIADNRIAELADLDMGKLMDMVQEMDTGIVPVELTGFTEEDLQKIIASMEGADDSVDDNADAEQSADDDYKPFSQLGDLWHLGNHRLVCGSATDTATIERLMDGRKAQLVHTDPPYGVSYKTQSGKFDMIANDDKTHDDLMAGLLVPAFRNYVRSTADDAAFYIWHASSTRRDFEDAMIAAGILEKQYIIWVKNAPVLGHADYQWAHEPCFYAEKAGQQAKWCGDRAQRTTWNVVLRGADGMATTLTGGVVLTDGTGNKLYLTDKMPKGKKVRYVRLSEGRSICLYQESRENTVWEVARESNTVHPTQKPVELPIRAITNSTEAGDLVIDFFGGSGSTLIAAEMTGRICYSTELDPRYVDAIIRRYIETSGKQTVTVERDGVTMTIDEVMEAAAGGDVDA